MASVSGQCRVTTSAVRSRSSSGQSSTSAARTAVSHAITRAPKAAHALGHRGADRAVAHDAHDRAGQLAGHERRAADPLAAADGGVEREHAAQRGEHQRDGVVGRGVAVGALG